MLPDAGVSVFDNSDNASLQQRQGKVMVLRAGAHLSEVAHA